MQKTLKRVRAFAPDFLLKRGHEHYMVKGKDKRYIHKSTFTIAKKRYPVKEEKV